MRINKRKFLTVVLPLAMMIAGGTYIGHVYRGQELLKVEVKPFRVNGGWGYNITVDNKIYIHQPTVPALAGNVLFSTRADAVKTGNLVIKKLIAGQFPSLSTAEIKGLDISPLLPGK